MFIARADQPVFRPHMLGILSEHWDTRCSRLDDGQPLRCDDDDDDDDGKGTTSGHHSAASDGRVQHSSEGLMIEALPALSQPLPLFGPSLRPPKQAGMRKWAGLTNARHSCVGSLFAPRLVFTGRRSSDRFFISLVLALFGHGKWRESRVNDDGGHVVCLEDA